MFRLNVIENILWLCADFIVRTRDHIVCVQVCVQVYERHGRRPKKRVGSPGGFDACWLDADGRIGTVNQAQQREEGVFFTQAVVCGSGDRKGQG